MIARTALSVALRALAECALAACALGGWACGAADYGVPSYPQPASSPAEVVAFPPPPAQIEHLDAKPPAEGCLWADGQWVWATQHWNWRPGGWVRPAEGCRYSAPTVQWASSPGPNGETSLLYYRPGRWYSLEEPADDETADGTAIAKTKPCPDPVSCPAQSPVRSNTEAKTGGRIEAARGS